MKTGKIDFTGDYIQDSTGFTQVATGGTAERPASADLTDGMIRFNTDNTIDRLEAYVNGKWVNLITDYDITPTGFSAPSGSNLTRAIVSAIVQNLNKSFMGSVSFGMDNPDGGAGTQSLPTWASNISGNGLTTWGINSTVGVNYISLGTNYNVNGSTIFSVQFNIDLAELGGVTSNRYNYRYDAFSIIFHSLNNSPFSGSWIRVTEMTPAWSSDQQANDPNNLYGKFTLTASFVGGQAASRQPTGGNIQMGVRWYANIYKYQNFSSS